MALDRTTYLALRDRLDFSRKFGPTIAVLLFDAGLLSLGVWLIQAGGAVGHALSQVLFAVVFFNSFSILHECGHGSASPSKAFNTLVGHYVSLLCFIPYFPWVYIHRQHHAWAGNIDRDPVLKSLKRWGERGGVPWPVRIAWRSWIPLGAFLQHVVYLSYPLEMVKSGEMTRGKAVRCAASVALLPTAYVALAFMFPEAAHPLNYVPALLLFLIAEELVNLPHHADMSTVKTKLPVWEQPRATRSCYYPRGISELCVLNFNFHIEHHLFPSLPWFRLRRARALVRDALGDDYTEAVGVSWNVSRRGRSIETVVSLPTSQATEAG